MGYRHDNTSGIATGDAPETIAMVTSGAHFNAQCCFDFECDKELSLGFARVSHRILPVRVLAQGLS